MITIDGVPESITRADYKKLIESVGLQATRLKSFEFRMDGIYAEVCTGFIETAPGEEDREATHRVYIPVVD